jgi:imidazole glycerol phosphate synthase subunit HisF
MSNIKGNSALLSIELRDRLDDQTIAQMEAAERVAVSLLTGGGVRFREDVIQAISEIARQVSPTAIADAEENLSTLDTLVEPLRTYGVLCPTDTACNRWTPEVETAYYVGLVIGMRLAGGVR